MAHDPRIMSPAEKIERGMKRLEAERDALRDALQQLRSKAGRVYEQAPTVDRLLHSYKELRAELQASGRVLASLEVES